MAGWFFLKNGKGVVECDPVVQVFVKGKGLAEIVNRRKDGVE